MGDNSGFKEPRPDCIRRRGPYPSSVDSFLECPLGCGFKAVIGTNARHRYPHFLRSHMIMHLIRKHGMTRVEADRRLLEAGLKTEGDDLEKFKRDFERICGK